MSDKVKEASRTMDLDAALAEALVRAQELGRTFGGEPSVPSADEPISFVDRFACEAGRATAEQAVPAFAYVTPNNEVAQVPFEFLADPSSASSGWVLA